MKDGTTRRVLAVGLCLAAVTARGETNEAPAGERPGPKGERIQPVGAPPVDEIVIKVKAHKRKRILSHTSTSSIELTHEDVKEQPGGEQVSLPKLITSTTPGVVAGAFGQMFFRGNHANIQYLIDGVQLPESPSNTFGDSFAPRNIDHMEIITGGIPAEFGERLSAVVNIVSRTGPETPGGTAELNYGSYNTFSPTLSYGGSSGDGELHYFFSLNYNRTDRGIDTPNPVSSADVTKGGSDIVHDMSNGSNEFAKVDWLLSNQDKLTFVAFNAVKQYQIPTFPTSLAPSASIFTAGDSFGNGPWVYFPPGFGDRQSQQDSYLQAVWKHTFSPRVFFQVAPYYKYSYVNVVGDPANDLAGATLVPGQKGDGTDPVYSTFNESRAVNNFGLRSDITYRPDDSNLVKVGIVAQASLARGSFTIQTAQNGQPGTGLFTDSTPNDGYFGSLYAQDDLTLARGDYAYLKSLVLNAGLRFDATRFNLGPGTNPTDSSLQPRVGLNYMPTHTTKLHIFYGKLFQPAPVENLRAAFVATSQGSPAPYDIKAEKSDYYEAGVAQEIPAINQTVLVTTYRKNSRDLLDDAQLLNTAIAQPINFATGYVYGTELSVHGQLTDALTDFANYSYTIARGSGLSGGLFTRPVGTIVGGGYQYLDHAQMHTVNFGGTYHWRHAYLTLQGVYGSGLRTGPNNSVALPGHLTMDASVGYEFTGENFWDKWRVSADVINMFDNRYPISVANGFNGSHYAAGLQVYGHVVKDL